MLVFLFLNLKKNQYEKKYIYMYINTQWCETNPLTVLQENVLYFFFNKKYAKLTRYRLDNLYGDFLIFFFNKYVIYK